MTKPSHVSRLSEIDRTQVAIVGGKGAHLGDLTRLEGVQVPAGFCVTTHVFERVVASVPALQAQRDRLERLRADDREEIRRLGADIRRTIEEIAIPDDVAAEITRAVAELGERGAYAVRSSATAEDLPTASFAGQQDTFLNVVGAPAILQHVRRCWASLFTERAVIYRLRNGVDQRKVHMAVVVQRMVLPQAAGILFTADPVTGNRKVTSIDASFGLGEAIVSGLVNADVYKARDGAIIEKAIARKRLTIDVLPAGGTEQRAIAEERQQQPVLTDAQVLQLERLGRRIEAHFGCPQDIEWCAVDDELFIVQSRPITTLFPIPKAEDHENHVYISVGHQQMMTDPFKPLGLSVWQLTTQRPMGEAGGRLFVDVTQALASPTSRASLLASMEKSDPRITDALQTILDRGDFVPTHPDAAPAWTPPGAGHATIETDPAIPAALIALREASIAALKRDIATKSGPALFDFILEDIQEMKRLSFDPRNLQVIMAAIDATWWLNEHLQTWLGETNVADTLTLSAPGNVTSEMGLSLLEVADVVRRYPEVVTFLRRVEDDDFLDDLATLEGGREVRDAIEAYLEKYGMRCAGEIDITRPRWSERPTALLPTILGNVENFEPGAGARRFEEGREEAAKKEREVLARLRALPDGEEKAEETKRMIDRVRTFIGYREYPKYGMVSRYFVYKQALLEEAERLVSARVLHEKEDVFYLRFQELHEVVRTQRVDEALVRQRKEAFRSYEALTPPRVLTSDGEALSGAYRRANVPDGALVGLPVSAGSVEGRARVVLDMAKADLEPGDILVTAFTDPSWTPAFIAIAGLVTEVGGLMSHGSVVAREYGLPAVVGVEDVTRRIRDGQRIRVNGTDGHVELLS